MRRALCLLAALACGAPAPPSNVRASARDGEVEAFWDAAPFVKYRVQLADLDTGQPASGAVEVKAGHAVLPGVASGVWVDALPGGRATALVSAGARGGSGAKWQIFAPWDYRGGELSATFAQLGPGERLGVLLVNFGGSDGAQADVSVEGTEAAAFQTSQGALAVDRPAPGSGLHETLRAQEAALALEVPAPVEAAQTAALDSFCVARGLDFSRHVRKRATLVVSTPASDLYVDDDDLGEYGGPELTSLAQTFASSAEPAVVAAFGPPPDVDANGKVLVVLTHELGQHLNGGWLIGYFGNADLVRARDTTADCSAGGSNHGEIVYLNDPAAGAANGYAKQDLFAAVYPATLAHELQHLINFGGRCVARACDGPQEVWINEALSKVAEDLAGYGWNSPAGRAEGTVYLSRAAGELRGYDGRSLMRWEGDPIGNYQGVHSFLRLFTDRFGMGIASRIAASRSGVSGVEEALGFPLPFAMAQWATALLLSNEDGAPYSFSGASWSPLHDRLRHLDTRAPGILSLRADGISAVLSGAGLGAAARLTVRSREEHAPYVVVVRASAALPER
jgi:hypothetical protein